MGIELMISHETRQACILRACEMLSDLPKASFADNLKTTFRASLQDGTIFEMELIEVIDRKSTPKQEQFSLMFRAPVDAPAEQQTFRLEHDQLESGELFLVPLAKDEKGIYFQAVFNRLID
jgi:hypothetical protein